MSTSIWARTKTALTSLSIPMAQNRYQVATGADLPDVFMVYQLIASPPEQHADNSEKLRAYLMQVNVFSRAGLNALPAVVAAMVAAGFTHGNDTELPFSEETLHFGLSMEFYYLEEQ